MQDNAKFQLIVEFYRNPEGTFLESYVKNSSKVWNVGKTQTYTNLTIDGTPAIKGEMTVKNETVPAIWFEHKGYIFTLYSTTRNSDYKTWFDEIVSTFKLSQ